MSARFTTIIVEIERHYGVPAAPKITDPWHMILHENAAYLVDDARRDEVFESLRARVGLEPTEILTAAPERITSAIARGGMKPELRAQKLIDAATIVNELGGDLRAALALPEPKARKALKRFPGIGDPSADRIFLFSRSRPFLALDSNALRVLVRLGFGTESPNYSKTYRTVVAAVAEDIPQDFESLIRSAQLLRAHGQNLCRRVSPECSKCPFFVSCPTALPVPHCD